MKYCIYNFNNEKSHYGDSIMKGAYIISHDHWSFANSENEICFFDSIEEAFDVVFKINQRMINETGFIHMNFDVDDINNIKDNLLIREII